MNPSENGENVRDKKVYCQYENAEFRAVMHELNNQLSVLDGNLHLAKKWAKSEEQVLGVIGEAAAASEAIKTLLDRLRLAAVGDESLSDGISSPSGY